MPVWTARDGDRRNTFKCCFPITFEVTSTILFSRFRMINSFNVCNTRRSVWKSYWTPTTFVSNAIIVVFQPYIWTLVVVFFYRNRTCRSNLNAMHTDIDENPRICIKRQRRLPTVFHKMCKDNFYSNGIFIVLNSRQA